MPKLLNYIDKDRKSIERMMLDILEIEGLPNRLIYENMKSDCPNCSFDPIGNKSTGRYKVGGPRPFTYGQLCPVCKGVGKIGSESSEEIIMTIEWNPKAFYMPVNIEIPNGYAQTMGKIEDLPRVLRSRKIVLNTTIEKYVKYTFNLHGEPVDNFPLSPGKFFTAMWKRDGS